jgi:hypothetical protein
MEGLWYYIIIVLEHKPRRNAMTKKYQENIARLLEDIRGKLEADAKKPKRRTLGISVKF